MSGSIAVLIVAGWLVLGLGCSREDERSAAPAPAPPSAAPAAPAPAGSANPGEEAKKVFAERCVTCHGATGAGDGPASSGLSPKPRDFSDRAWQESVTDSHIEQIIQYGGAAVGRSAAMPGNPDLTAKPEVVAAIRAYVRGLAAQ